MHNYLYIHGYGGSGNAQKAQLLQQMFPKCNVHRPTIDYDHENPYDILNRLKKIIYVNHVELIVGSSMGGYFALCCSLFFDGTIWTINPVRDIMRTIERHINALPNMSQKHVDDVKKFDKEIFQNLHPKAEQLNFALSADDELLGPHEALLKRFPQHNHVIWKEPSLHRFTRFEELKPYLTL